MSAPALIVKAGRRRALAGDYQKRTRSCSGKKSRPSAAEPNAAYQASMFLSRPQHQMRTL